MDDNIINSRFSDQLEKVSAQQEQVLERLNSIESDNKSRGKDGWDKFGVVSQFVSGVVIAIAGVFFSYSYQRQQNLRELEATELQRVQTIGTFMPYLTSKDGETKHFALTQVNSILGTASLVDVALQVNNATQLNAPADQEKPKPDPVVASVLEGLAAQARTLTDRQLASNALLQITCGRERLPIKTLSDPGAAAVRLVPIETTVAQLVAISRPSPLTLETRMDPVENQTYRVVARIVDVKQESDKDYHITISDPVDSTKTMIAEIPSPDCYKGGDAQLATKFTDARNQIDGLFDRSTQRFRQPGGDVEVAVTGVGFFDIFHGQRGMAPNGLELHPVLGLEVVDARTKR